MIRDVPVAARGSAVDWPPVRDCFVELFRVLGGDTSSTRAAIGRLRAFAALDPPPVPREGWGPIDFRVCPLLLETLLEGGRDRGGASRLDALDAVMRDGPRWLTLAAPATPVAAANWAIARLRESQGDYPRARRDPPPRKQLLPGVPVDPSRVPPPGRPARGPRGRHRRRSARLRFLSRAARQSGSRDAGAA